MLQHQDERVVLKGTNYICRLAKKMSVFTYAISCLLLLQCQRVRHVCNLAALAEQAKTWHSKTRSAFSDYGMRSIYCSAMENT